MLKEKQKDILLLIREFWKICPDMNFGKMLFSAIEETTTLDFIYMDDEELHRSLKSKLVEIKINQSKVKNR